MKNLLLLHAYAVPHGEGFPSNIATWGRFDIPSRGTGATLRVVASSGRGWDHASVSTRNRCPNWTEMSLVKELFWDEEADVMQYHPPKSEHISMHEYCLHLWRPHPYVGSIIKPPSSFVGVKGMTMAQVKRMPQAARHALALKIEHERAQQEIAESAARAARA